MHGIKNEPPYAIFSIACRSVIGGSQILGGDIEYIHRSACQIKGFGTLGPHFGEVPLMFRE